MKDERPVAQADFVAGFEERWPGNALAVHERAILRRRVVQFAPLGRVNHDGAVPPRDATIEDGDIAKIGHDLKRDLIVLRRAGVQLRGIAFDTEVASYVLDPGRREHSLAGLAGILRQYEPFAFRIPRAVRAGRAARIPRLRRGPWVLCAYIACFLQFA